MYPTILHFPHTIIYSRSSYSDCVLVVLNNIFISNTDNYETSTQKYKWRAFQVDRVTTVQALRQGCWGNVQSSLICAYKHMACRWTSLCKWSPSLTKPMIIQTNNGFWAETFLPLQFCFMEIFHERDMVDQGGQVGKERQKNP